MFKLPALTILLLLSSHNTFSQLKESKLLQTKDKIVLKTHSGDSITVFDDIIHFNSHPISAAIEGIIYTSKYNRLIEEDGTTLLFLAIDDRPGFNKLRAFKLTKQKATGLAGCVYNDATQGIGPGPLTDMDGDGKLEFGGFDITEVPPSRDSMYYNPSQYYEINHGMIQFDSVLTRKMDIKINGIYLSNPLNKEGNCCVVIKKPTARSKNTSK